MHFKLNFNIEPFPVQLYPGDSIVLMGSCFAGNIHAKLKPYKFNTCCNPSGILFNPLSITASLNSFLNPFTAHDTLYQSGGLWHSWLHHGSFSTPVKDELINKLHTAHALGSDYLKTANLLIITWGSAYVYELVSNRLVVANCHKVPLSAFNKRLLTVNEIVDAYNTFFETMYAANPNIQVMISISPVRYTRDGLHQNNVSKGTLMLALHTLLDTHPKLMYFPAYEIVNDELRDYRFFERDMVHPNYLAIDYIWVQFSEACLSSDAKHLVKVLDPIIQAMKHRPVHAGTEDHAKFIAATSEKIKRAQQEFPDLDFSPEIKYFSAH